MWEDLGEYILTITDKRPLKIAEIGVGKVDLVYQYLKKQDQVDIIKTDIRPADESVIKDDITNPNLDLYKDVDIIYSIRPPTSAISCKIKRFN